MKRVFFTIIVALSSQTLAKLPPAPPFINDRCKNPFKKPSASQLIKAETLKKNSGVWMAAKGHAFNRSYYSYPSEAVYSSLSENRQKQIKKMISEVNAVELTFDMTDLTPANPKLKIICSSLDKKSATPGSQNLSTQMPFVINAKTIIPTTSYEFTYDSNDGAPLANVTLTPQSQSNPITEFESSEVPKNMVFYFIKNGKKSFKFRFEMTVESEGKVNLEDKEVKLPIKAHIITEQEYVYKN